MMTQKTLTPTNNSKEFKILPQLKRKKERRSNMLLMRSIGIPRKTVVRLITKEKLGFKMKMRIVILEPKASKIATVITTQLQ